MALSVCLRSFAAGDEIVQLGLQQHRSIYQASKWLSHTDEKGRYRNADYAYTRSKLVHSPFLKSISLQHIPGLGWQRKLLGIQSNILQRKGFAQGLLETGILLKIVAGLPVELSPQRARDVADFIQTLYNKSEDVLSYLDFAGNVKTTVSDKALGEYRLSGPNPVTVRPATINDLKLLGNQLEQDKNLLNLIDKKQLFVVDYSLFASLKANKVNIKGTPKINLGSIALFRQEGQTLAPICIKVIGNHSGKPEIGQSKIFYPNNSDYGWEIAKSVFQSNDNEFHLSLAHLGGTHLVSEVFLVATHRRLPEEHPVHKLLAAHFEGTAFINEAADKTLISDNGLVDRMVSADLEQVRQQVQIYTESITATDMRFPERIKARQMDKANTPDLDYPYRDDGQQHWDAIYEWVTNYIRIFYANDAAVAADSCLRGWIEELKATDGGNVRWLDSFEYTTKWLSDVIASVIFISSVDHAAVNFSQRPYLQFTPAFPTALYGSSEEPFFKPKPDKQDYLGILPPLSASMIQSQVAHVLGSLIHTRLGYYQQQVPWFSRTHYFSGIRGGAGLEIPKNYLEVVDGSLNRFQMRLDTVTKKINERNENRKHHNQVPYTFLLPENVTQSINI